MEVKLVLLVGLKGDLKLRQCGLFVIPDPNAELDFVEIGKPILRLKHLFPFSL